MAGTPWEDISMPDSEIKRKMRLNTEGRHSIEIHSEQECDEIIAVNRDLRNEENFSGSLWNGRDMVRVASIPLIELERWRKEEGIDFWRFNDEDKARITQKLNDPSFSAFRTAPGRI